MKIVKQIFNINRRVLARESLDFKRSPVYHLESERGGRRSGTQRYAVVRSGTQWHAVVRSGTQWHAVVTIVWLCDRTIGLVPAHGTGRGVGVVAKVEREPVVGAFERLILETRMRTVMGWPRGRRWGR